MMGWKEGTGLGTDGDGRVDPIQTAIYAQGVGLGASKGKDISKITEAGYGGYVQMAQEAVRRFLLCAHVSTDPINRQESVMVLD